MKVGENKLNIRKYSHASLFWGNQWSLSEFHYSTAPVHSSKYYKKINVLDKKWEIKYLSIEMKLGLLWIH